MTEAFYVPDGETFVATGYTRGPWDPRSQHAGPPSALFGHVFERLPSDMPMQIARFTHEILRPIPIARLRVDARVARPGKRVQLCEAVMTTDDGDAVARASCWRIRVEDGASKETSNAIHALALPDELETFSVPRQDDRQRIVDAMELRFARSDFVQNGPAAGWFRMKIPLIAGIDVEPLSRVLVAADFANGISHEVDFGTSMFINTELTVHLARYPEGEWVLLDSATHQGAQGVGISVTALWDQRALIGQSAQALYIGAR